MTGGGSRGLFSYLGLIGYREAYDLQLELVRRRVEGEITDTLLLLEHPPTITIGRFGRPENVLASESRLETEGISLISSDRGGDVTYHGPGQLVGYPIIDLGQRGNDVRRYVRDLEEVIIRVLRLFGIAAARDPGHPGVWVGSEEIAAIGLRVRKWVSMHGFALNVSPNLDHFSFIKPCGLEGREATSMSRLLGHTVPLEAVIERLLACFSDVFCIELERSAVRVAGLPLVGV